MGRKGYFRKSCKFYYKLPIAELMSSVKLSVRHVKFSDLEMFQSFRIFQANDLFLLSHRHMFPFCLFCQSPNKSVMYLVDSSKTKASHEIQYSNPST